MRGTSKTNNGFTLVELIVVLVILAILAALLVPALLGYIDRAKNQQYILEAKELMNATQAGIVDAYAHDKKAYEACIKPDKSGGVIDSVEYGYFTSDWVAKALNGTAYTQAEKTAAAGPAKIRICKEIKKYVEKGNYDLYNGLADNQTVASLGGKQAFFIAFSRRGEILYMQYAKNGILVTFDGKGFSAEEGGSFIKFRN